MGFQRSGGVRIDRTTRTVFFDLEKPGDTFEPTMLGDQDYKLARRAFNGGYSVRLDAPPGSNRDHAKRAQERDGYITRRQAELR